MNNEKMLLVASIRNNLFASRDTIDEALNYAVATIDRLYDDNRAAMYTVLHVVMNTIADKINALPDQLPEPPAEVLVNSDGIQIADLPATGEQSLNEKIADIVDQRILYHSVAISKIVERKVNNAIEEWNENTQFDTIIEEWFDDNVDIEQAVKETISTLSISINVE